MNNDVQIVFDPSRPHLYTVYEDFFMMSARLKGATAGHSMFLSLPVAKETAAKLKKLFARNVELSKIQVYYDDRDSGSMAAIIRDRQLVVTAPTWGEVHSVFRDLDIKLERQVTYYFIGDHGVTSSSVAINTESEDPIHPDLFGHLDVSLLCSDYMESRDPILILYGVPGVGKTTFLKYLIQEHSDVSIAYIKDATTLKSSRTWKSLQDADHDILILDDLDLDLLRDKERDDFVTQLLSFSDGIFGKRTKIVITTNTPIDKVDEAMVRPGRCFDFIYLQPLTQAQAYEVWMNILNAPSDAFDVQDGHITQADLMRRYFAYRDNKTPRRYMPEGERCTLTELLKKHGVTIQSMDEKFGL